MISRFVSSSSAPGSVLTAWSLLQILCLPLSLLLSPLLVFCLLTTLYSYSMLTTNVATICHMQCYYITIDYIPHAMPFILMTYSFHNWTLISHSSSSIFPSLCPLPLATVSFFLWFYFLFVYSFVLLCRFHIEVKPYGICPLKKIFFFNQTLLCRTVLYLLK